MIIYYDSYCELCTKSSTLWGKLDWQHKLIFESFRTLESCPPEMEENLHIAHKNKIYIGFNAIIQIIKQLPLLWIFLIVMYPLKWLGLGQFIYKKIAQNRKLVPVSQCDSVTCEIPKK